jgi:hypothetical protein
MSIAHRRWLITPLVPLFLIDILFTLAGQSTAYWNGEYETAVEANPLARIILLQGPECFGILAILWGLIQVVIILAWRHVLAVWFAIVLTIAHALGSCSWLFRYESGWLYAIGYLVVVSELVKGCWRKAGVLSAASPASVVSAVPSER